MSDIKGAAAVVVSLFTVMVFAGACTGSSSLPSTPAGSSVPGQSGAPVTSESPPAEETPEPGESVDPDGSVPPDGSPTPEESLPPEESFPPEGTPPPEETPPAEETPEPTPAGGTAACTGTAANRTFFQEIAGTVDWDVYCAVLPARWHIDSDPSKNTFSLAGGGRMQIAYVGPGGARLTLQQGSFCTAGVSACSPRDQTIGDASFGDRTGTLVTLGPDKGFALYVDSGQAPSWALTGTGMDQATFVALAAALHRIELAEP